MLFVAAGPFDVSLKPLVPYDQAPGAGVGRMSIDKTYHGDLDATGVGEMVAAHTAVPGSAVYVAVERVTGTLAGRTGSFVLYHTATLTRGAPDLRIVVCPDSGTGEMEGLAGAMHVDLSEGKHAYRFEYTIDSP
ncbi:MAG TPA: DUF3224 domain-containing protein [Gemmatimonadaceae bacterium]|nr:DUF3224 domain-containing protein [Gemmatimonadaceae bacterium]